MVSDMRGSRAASQAQQNILALSVVVADKLVSLTTPFHRVSDEMFPGRLQHSKQNH
jgi:hypothetical protein